MALKLSRELGVLVKSTPNTKESLEQDKKRIVETNKIHGTLSVKNAASDIKISVDFKSKHVSMSVKVIPPLDKGTKAKFTWIDRQLENSKKKSEGRYLKIEKDLWVEADIKYIKAHQKEKVNALELLYEKCNGAEIQAFNVTVDVDFKSNFKGQKTFIFQIEQLVIDFYAGIVQNMANWSRPAPKLN